MCALHEEVVVADNGLSLAVCGTVDDHIFADDIVVAYDTLTFLSSELKVLGERSNDGTLVYFVVFPYA